MNVRTAVAALIVCSTALLSGCGECSDCNRLAPSFFAVLVTTSTDAGPLKDAIVRVRPSADLTLLGSTDSAGHAFFSFAADARTDSATVTVTAPAGYASPAPFRGALVEGETLEATFLIAAAP